MVCDTGLWKFIYQPVVLATIDDHDFAKLCDEQLRLLRRPQQDLTRERLRRLGHYHCDDVRNVLWLEHLLRALSRMWREIRMHRSGAYYGDANVVDPQLFSHGIGQSIESPL